MAFSFKKPSSVFNNLLLPSQQNTLPHFLVQYVSSCPQQYVWCIFTPRTQSSSQWVPLTPQEEFLISWKFKVQVELLEFTFYKSVTSKYLKDCICFPFFSLPSADHREVLKHSIRSFQLTLITVSQWTQKPSRLLIVCII